MTPNEIETFVGGKVFSVKFVKRSTGEVRQMRCRLNVNKGVKGVGPNYNPSEHNLIRVYVMPGDEGYDPNNPSKNYRSIPVENIKEIRCGAKILL